MLNAENILSQFDSSARETSQSAANPDDWPEPQDIPCELSPVEAMVEEMIPEPFRKWLCDISERMQCPLEFPTIGAIVTIGSLIGRRLAIRPKRQDDWEVIPNLWGGIVGRPGIMKSPALTEAMKPLSRLEHEAQQENESAKQQQEIETFIRKAQKLELEKKIKEAIADGADPKEIAGSYSLPGEQDEPTPERRFIVNDTTVEKLGELLNQNPNGLLLFRDELTGWLKTLDREGHENDRAFYLESWNGIGRGTLHIKAACMSILGGIQPGPLSEYLRLAVKGGAGADGLFQRFQLLVYPDDAGQWRNVDRWPDTEAKNRAYEVYKKINGEGFGSFVSTLRVDIHGENKAGTVPFLRFSPKGQVLFDGWRQELENKIRTGDEHPVVEAHLSKYRSLMPSLALVFHVMGIVDGREEVSVSEDAAKIAAAWCDYLELHARRIYQGFIHQDIAIANLLARRIKKGQLTGPFTVRQVYRKGWTGLSEAGEIEKGAAILEELGWLRSNPIMPGEKGGKPTVEYHVNPRLNGKGG